MIEIMERAPLSVNSKKYGGRSLDSLANLPAGTRTWFQKEFFAAKQTRFCMEKKTETDPTSGDRTLKYLLRERKREMGGNRKRKRERVQERSEKKIEKEKEKDRKKEASRSII
jgi:hypothetical protein